MYWGEEKNRKEFFDKIAQREDFDALVPENWYWMPKSKIFDTQVII